VIVSGQKKKKQFGISPSVGRPSRGGWHVLRQTTLTQAATITGLRRVETPQRGRRGTWQQRYDSALLVPTALPLPPLPPAPSATLSRDPTRPPSSSRHYAADALPLPRQGKLPHHYSAILPRVPDSGLHSSPSLSAPTVPHRRRLCRLSRGIPTRLPPLNFPAGTRGRFLRRRGVARRVRAASPRRDERAKPAQKVPFGRKTSLFLSLLLHPIVSTDPILHLSLFLRPPPRDSSSSTSAGSFSLCSKTLSGLFPSSHSCSFCLGSSFSGPSAILFLSVPWQGRTMQRDPGARIRGG